MHKLVSGIEQLLKANGVEVFRGRGVLESPGRIRIHRPEVTGHIRARNIILATGSVPARPKGLPIDGKNVLTSNEILAIKDLPSSLLVVGGGYIGCEFASIFSTLGTQVVLVEQLPALLARSDRQAVREVEKALKEQGVTIHLGTSVERLDVEDGRVQAHLSGGETVVTQLVLVSVGRAPNSAGVGYEEAGIRMERGAVVVDEELRTSAPGIFAIGDVIAGAIQLAHVASYQAAIAVANALGGAQRVDYRVVPSVVFTSPELAQVGLTEDECKERGLKTSVGRFTYQASGKALCDGEPRGSVKIIADADSGVILGASIVGEEASALVSEVAAAMQQGMSALSLGEVIHAHPTLPEMIMEAAEDTAGKAVHKVGRASRRKPASK